MAPLLTGRVVQIATNYLLHCRRCRSSSSEVYCGDVCSWHNAPVGALGPHEAAGDRGEAGSNSSGSSPTPQATTRKS